MAKIVMVSNAPTGTPTGYSQQTAQLALRAKAAGHDISISANHGAPVNMEWEGIKIHAEGLVKYSNDAAPENIALAAQSGGFGLTLFDTWVGVNEMWHVLPIVAWVPVDHDPVPPLVAAWCLKGNNKHIVAMSKHGEQALLACGVPRERLTYIPHAIDRSVFKAEGPTLRTELRVPQDAHLTMITAMNKGKRKSYPEMLRGWTQFAKRHEDAYLYIHTDRFGHLDGINLIPLLKIMDAPAERIRWVNTAHMRGGIAPETVAALMRSADVLLATSRGEGFGLPVIEAQAVGTPVIVTNHTAQPELVRKYGHIVEGQLDYDDFQVAYYKIPWIKDIDDRLEMSWCAKRDNVIDRAALAATMDEYDADKVYAEKWEPLFRSIESGKIKLGAPAAEPVPVNRAARRGKR